MKYTLQILTLVLITLLFSCSKGEIDPELTGTWEVTKVEGQQFYNGAQGIYLVDNNPSGTIEFKKNGRGEQDYSFTLFGTVYEQKGSFTWSATELEVIIERNNDDDLIWSRLVSESKKQVATYDIVVDAQNTARYTLTLEK